MFMILVVILWIVLIEVNNEYRVYQHYEKKRPSYYPKTDKPKIVFMGGSATYGYPYKEENSFPKIVEKMLNKYEVVNLGVSGDRVEQILKRVDDCLKCNPEYIVLAPVWNDVNYALVSYTTNKNRIGKNDYYSTLYIIKKKLYKLFGRNFFTKVLWRLIHRFLSTIFVRVQPMDIEVIRFVKKKFFDDLDKLMDKLKGQKVVFLLLPSNVSLTGKSMTNNYLWGNGIVGIFNNVSIYSELVEREVVFKIAQKHNASIFDITSLIRLFDCKKQLFVFDDYHFTEYANEIIGKIISQYLNNEILTARTT